MAENSTEKTEKTTKYEHNRTYLVKIDTVTSVVSKKKETPGFRVSVVGSAGEVDGERLTDTVWVTEKTKWKMQNLLRAAGVTALPARDEITLFKTFSGKEVLIKTILEKGRENELGGTYPDAIRIGNFLGGSSNPEVIEDSAEVSNTNVPF